jgi:hypothetical protein
MKYVVIYPHTSEARASIWAKLVEWSKRPDFQEKGISAHHFKVVRDWPPKEVLHSFPLNLQIEEVIIENDTITTTRKLIIDIVEIFEQEKPVEQLIANA